MLADLINQIKSTIDLTDDQIQNFVKYIVDTEEGLKKMRISNTTPAPPSVQKPPQEQPQAPKKQGNQNKNVEKQKQHRKNEGLPKPTLNAKPLG